MSVKESIYTVFVTVNKADGTDCDLDSVKYENYDELMAGIFHAITMAKFQSIVFSVVID